MMFEYILRLMLLVPLVGGLAWGSLWLWRRVQLGLPVAPQASRPAKMVDVLPMGTSGKLAVVEFGGRHLLIAVSRNAINLIADEAPSKFQEGDFHAE
jgi:flagellar protein FliO/FliZ